MTEIIPAILPKSFAELTEKMSLVAGLVPMVQIDVADGRFVPNKTWPYTAAGDPKNDKDFSEILAERADFPFVNELDFEADLMVAEPLPAARDWLHAGAKRIIIHLESIHSDAAEFFRALQKEVPPSESLLHVEIGVAINPDTPNEMLAPLMDEIDFVQFMGIARIGFQGEKFDERVLGKIADLRARFPKATISVDGGVTSEIAPKLIAAGANHLAVGSAIFVAGTDRPAVAAAIDAFSAAVDAI